MYLCLNQCIRLVMGMSSDKDIAACIPHALSIVNSQQQQIHCTAVRISVNVLRCCQPFSQAKHPRAINIAELRNILCRGSPVPELSSTLDNSCVFHALRAAINQAARDSDTSTIVTNTAPSDVDANRADAVVIVCGTAFIMSDARFELGVEEARDGEELFFSPAQLMPTVSIARDAQPN